MRPSLQTLLFAFALAILTSFPDRAAAINSPTAHLDFGTSRSPVAIGYARVPLIPFNASLGYGWQRTAGILAVDQNTRNALTRDLHTGVAGNFLVELVPGTYDVTLTLGDYRNARPNVRVFLQGQAMGTVSTRARQYIATTYRTNTLTGLITIGLVAPSARSRFSIEAVDIVQISAATPTPTPTPFATPTPSDPGNPGGGAVPDLGNNASLNGFRVFPANDPWKIDVSGLPVDADSARYLTTYGTGTGLHPDFGTVYAGQFIGIPYTVVPPGQTPATIDFHLGYADESDPGPYPVPADAQVEGQFQDPTVPDTNNNGDRHLIVLDYSANKLYELYRAFRLSPTAWRADSGAVWDLSRISYGQRPTCWTSSDAAGLPIFPGLVRYDEVVAGEINHAIRVTFNRTRRAFVPPATHYASSDDTTTYLPMGARLRLRASFNVEDPRFGPDVRVVLRALKKYGMIVADNGSNFYLSGSPDLRWNDDSLHALGSVKGADFEVIDLTAMGPISTRSACQ